MEEIAPGSILQRMYFRSRVRKNASKTFCEIGSGNGALSHTLLKDGLTGIGFDLNTSACENNKVKNAAFIAGGAYQVKNADFLEERLQTTFDLIFSSMVIEHLEETDVARYFAACKAHLAPNGRIVVFVPAGMQFWGIEDEIAGHFRRYAFSDFQDLAARHHLVIRDLAGLTYPLSNWLFGLSNRIIAKSESHKKNLSKKEQTVLSGNRGVKFKTVYPWYYKIFLNEVVLSPFSLLQRLNRNNPRSMVIYCEFSADGCAED